MADLPLLPILPLESLKIAAGEAPEAHAAIDALHQELQGNPPDPARIKEHVDRAKGFPALLAPLESWWLDPRTQTFLADLNGAGL